MSQGALINLHLCRKNLSQAWREAVRVLDYVKLMAA
jgi:hypothetical protein